MCNVFPFRAYEKIQEWNQARGEYIDTGEKVPIIVLCVSTPSEQNTLMLCVYPNGTLSEVMVNNIVDVNENLRP